MFHSVERWGFRQENTREKPKQSRRIFLTQSIHSWKSEGRLNNQVLHQSEQAFAFQKCFSVRAPCYAVWNRQLRTVSALRPWLTDNTGVCAQAGSNFTRVNFYYLFVPATTRVRELNLSPLTMNVASSIPSCMSNCMIRPSDFTTETLTKSLS